MHHNEKISKTGYRWFGQAYPFLLHESSIPRITILEDRPDMLPRNVGNQLPIYAAQYPRGAKASFIAMFRKPHQTLSSALSQ